MLITITEASAIAGYKSTSTFRKMLFKRFGHDNQNIQKVGNYYVVDRSFAESLNKNPGKGKQKKEVNK